MDRESGYELTKLDDQPKDGDEMEIIAKASWVNTNHVDEIDEMEIIADASWVKTNHADEVDDGRPKDVWFAVLFVLHLAGIIFLFVKSILILSKDKNDNINDKDDTHGYLVLLYLAIPSGLFAFVAAFIVSSVAIPLGAQTAIKYGLVSLVVESACFFLYCLVQNAMWCSIVAGVILIVNVIYIVTMWRFLPFAASVLDMALKGVNTNWGTYLLSLFVSVLNLVWICAWILIFYTIFQMINTSDSSYYDQGQQDPPYSTYQTNTYGSNSAQNQDMYYTDDIADGILNFKLFLLLVSLYWTCSVLRNFMQVTVAGVMGTWCLLKHEADSCCSSALASSVHRASTLSFGSICMGSLLQAIVSALRTLARHARHNSRNNHAGMAILCCVLQCLLYFLDNFIKYLNSWAYVFVGIYGISYLNSGKYVMQLFEAKGITAIVSNDFAGIILSFASLLIAITTGFVAFTINAILSSCNLILFSQQDRSDFLSFFLGFVIGLFVAGTTTNVVRGAVKAVIICFVDQPSVLMENHPEETLRLTNAWMEAFPEECSFFESTKSTKPLNNIV